MKRGIWVMAIVSAAVASPGHAAYTLTMTIDNVTLPQSSSVQTGWLDGYLQVTGTAPTAIQFDFQFDVVGSTPSVPIILQGSQYYHQPGTVAGDPRAFVLPSASGLNAFGITYEPATASTPTVLYTYAADNNNFLGNTLVNGTSFVRFEYSIPANATGTWNLNIDTLASDLIDPSVNFLTYGVSNGSITVTPASVPEPGTWAALVSGGACAAGVWYRRRRKAAAKAAANPPAENPNAEPAPQPNAPADAAVRPQPAAETPRGRPLLVSQRPFLRHVRRIPRAKS